MLLRAIIVMKSIVSQSRLAGLKAYKGGTICGELEPHQGPSEPLHGLCTRWYWKATLCYAFLMLIQNDCLFCMATNNTTLLLKKFLLHYKIPTMVVIGCWHKRDEFTLMKHIAQEGVCIKMFNLNGGKISFHSLNAEHKPVAVVLDMQCQTANEILKQAFQQNFCHQRHYWLLLCSEDLRSEENNVKTFLSFFNIPLDSQVHILYQGSKIMVQDVYQINDKEPLIITSPHEWVPERALPIFLQRDDFRGITLKAAVTVIQDPWEHFLDLRYRHLNTMSKLSYVLTCYLAEMLNFRMELIFTDSWGYPIKDSRTYSGVVGLLQQNIVDIGATTLLIKPARLDFIDYAAEAFPFVGAMMFLKPSLSEISILYLLPFSTSVWVAIVLIVALLTAALLISSHCEQKIAESSPFSWGEGIINTVGVVCQQGSPRPPQTISSRIIYLFLLLLSLFLVVSYSAIIVSLLQMSSSTISTLTDLLDSSFQMSMRNITYSITYVNDTNDPAVKRFYYEKLYTQPYDKAFTSYEIGIANVRKGFHAFQGDADAYKVISDTFEEHEKCRYSEITVFVTNVLAYPVRKDSPLKEFIARKARWLREIGFTDREYKRWYHRKPKCNSNNNKHFVSVRIQDFYPALLVLTYGIIASFCIFCFEIIYHMIGYSRYDYISTFSKSLTKENTYPLPIKVG